MFYEDVFRKLDEEQVEYVVVGGVALVLHGVVRFTADLDLFVELSEANLRKFVNAMKSLGTNQRSAGNGRKRRECWCSVFITPNNPCV